MKIRIQGRLLQGGHVVTEFTVTGDDLPQAILSLAIVVAPHLESERQVQIASCAGWCETCESYHTDVVAVLKHFDEFNVEASKKVTEMFKGVIRNHGQAPKAKDKAN